MPVLVDNIEKQIEKITEILNSRIVVYHCLEERSSRLAKLSQKGLLPIEYFYPFKNLITLFNEKKIIIPIELQISLGEVLFKFNLYHNPKEITGAINYCSEVVNALGESTL